jgi:hypothetical protein
MSLCNPVKNKGDWSYNLAIFNVGTRRNSVMSFKPRSLCPRRKSCPYYGEQKCLWTAQPFWKLWSRGESVLPAVICRPACSVWFVPALIYEVKYEGYLIPVLTCLDFYLPTLIDSLSLFLIKILHSCISGTTVTGYFHILNILKPSGYFMYCQV